MSNEKTVSTAIELLLQVLTAAGPVSAAIHAAHAEGRTISREELQAAFDQDDAARDSLADAIARHGG